MKHIRVEYPDDTLALADGKIYAKTVDGEYSFSVEDVEKAVILTTDMGPYYDDMGLAVDVGNETAIFIMSSHRCYQDFLFEQLGKALPIDFQKIIEASVCIDNKVFEIYTRQK